MTNLLSNITKMSASLARLSLVISLTLAIFIGSPTSTFALENPEQSLAAVGVNPKLGDQVDRDLKFTDENGQERTLRELTLSGRPTILVPAYYHCPRLCGLLLDGVTTLINSMALTLGKDYSVVTVSFDPTDTTEVAAEKAQFYRSKLKSSDGKAWHFLTGKQENIDALMKKLGFTYVADDGEWAHTAAIFLLTPNGDISNFFANVQFEPQTVRYSMIEASQGSIGTPFDQVFLFCFRYDHSQGKYTWAAYNIMRTGGFLTLSFLVFLIYSLWNRERRKGRIQPAAH